MSFNWSEYLNVATELANSQVKMNGTNEARLRASISRAYYAAFCTSRNYIENKNRTRYRNSRAHGDVEQAYRTLANQNIHDPKKHTTAANIADTLFDLRKFRKNADYDDQFNGLQYTNTFCLQSAALLISWLNLAP